MKLGPKRIVRPSTAYGINSGNFAISRQFYEGEKSRWRAEQFHYCRDRFREVFKSDQRNLLFCVPQNEVERISAFIWAFEDKLGIKERHTRMGITNRANLMWVKVSKFWMESSMRRSLFTALLRAGRLYDPEKENFWDAIRSVYYLNDSLPAVERFLEGYTVYAKKQFRDGWHAVFSHKDKKKVKELLVKP